MTEITAQENIRVVKDFFAALGKGNEAGLHALVAGDMEWIVPGENWLLAGKYRGHTGLAEVLQKSSGIEMTYPEPPEYVGQGDRVLVIGSATGVVKATNKAFVDHWVFAITVRNGKLANIREYIDTQAMARASSDI